MSLPMAACGPAGRKSYGNRRQAFTGFTNYRYEPPAGGPAADVGELNVHDMQDIQPTDCMARYQDHSTTAREGFLPNQTLPSYSFSSPPGQCVSGYPGQDGSPSYNYVHQSGTPLSNFDHHSSYSLSNSRSDWSSHPAGPSSSLNLPPSLAVPCPRISRVNTVGRVSQPKTPTESSSSTPVISPHIDNAYGYAPPHFSPSLTPDNKPLAMTQNWQAPGESAFQPYPSSDFQIASQSVSPRSASSDFPEERPRRRRRTTLSSSSGSVVSGSSEVSENTFSRPPSASWSPQNSQTPKAGLSRKARGKRPQPQPPAETSSSFSIFMVAPSPATHEPVGATYMSTVNFDADADASSQAFEHGPTDLPPRMYVGGPDATSPWKPRRNLGTIPGSALDYLPTVEDRMARLERALDAYVRFRGEQAVRNSVLPGMDTVPDQKK
ncbi:hypothetical protein M0805_008698 [Coniferiporia weirii]|nr:hypothetical protein M0805_008698 [Coniferiporia weirii]